MSAVDNSGPHDSADHIGPEYSPKRTFREHLQHLYKAFTTKQGLIGTYDYGVLHSRDGSSECDEL